MHFQSKYLWHFLGKNKKPLKEMKLVKGHTNYQIRITFKDILNVGKKRKEKA